MFATLLCTYVIGGGLTMLLTLALRDNPLAVLHGLATLVQMSIAVHIAVTFGLLIGAIVVYGRGGWSFEKRIGRVTTCAVGAVFHRRRYVWRASLAAQRR